MRSLKKLNLLFVEDNLPFARNTTEFLKNYFRKIIHAPSIKEALLEFEDNRIDLIFCDIKLQDGNGLDFIETVRAKNAAIPIVVLSAHKDEEFLFQAIPLGILSYELKPLKYENFIKLLQKIASKFSQKAPLPLTSALLYDPHAKEIIKGLLRIKLTKKEILFFGTSAAKRHESHHPCDDPARRMGRKIHERLGDQKPRISAKKKGR